jgi:hypothetical protein
MDTLDILNKLFDEDPKLKPTKPTKEYHVDKIKLENWKKLAESNFVENFNYIEYHFDYWLKSLAYSIDTLIEIMNTSPCNFIISNGETREKDQSISELWMYYIFSEVMKTKGYIIEKYDEYYNRITKSKIASCDHLVFIDDMVRTGSHISGRILLNPNIEKFLLDSKTKIYIVAPIFVTPKIFKKNFIESGENIFSIKYPGKEKQITLNFANRIFLISGIIYDIEKYPHIIVDHNGSDKYDVVLSYGYGGYGREIRKKLILLGSLIEGSDINSPYRYPPPLYYLTFGNGSIPKMLQQF